MALLLREDRETRVWPPLIPIQPGRSLPPLFCVTAPNVNALGFAFLARRFEQLKALDVGAKSNKTVVADYIFEKDKLFAYLNLSDVELDTYNRYYNYFREQLPTPDVVIYLQASPEVLRKRLKKKSVAAEKAISQDYLEAVVKAYEHFFFHYTASDLLIVNTSDIDFVDRNEDLQELLRKVSEPIKGTQYFLPLGSEAASA